MTIPSTIPTEILDALTDAVGATFALGFAHKTGGSAELQAARRLEVLANASLLQLSSFIEVPA